MVTQKEVKLRLKQLDKYLLKEYKEKYSVEVKNSKDYDQSFHRRMKSAIKFLNPLIKKATKDVIHIQNTGRPQKFNLEIKLRLILIKQLIDKSNRFTSSLLDLFYLMFGAEISYKYIERLYSDGDVIIALNNLFILIIEEKNIEEIDCCGDATGYSLSITKHYCSYATKLKEKSKVQKHRRQFVYNFALMDLKSRMYVCYGTSLRSEKDSYNKAIKMLNKGKIKIKSMRLDRYYSGPSTLKEFPDTKFYLIPKKNVALKNGFRWHEMLNRFVKNTFQYLKEYFRRNNSEGAFSVDKKLLGWKINQKRGDRIDTAIFCKNIWRNLFQLGR